jgi:type VI secretion system protein ImpC
VGAVIADYYFGHDLQDMELLRKVATVSAMAHAPFFAAVGKEFFRLDKWRDLYTISDLSGYFDDPKQYTHWKKFRENPDARYIGLALPGFLLRPPYGEDATPGEDNAPHGSLFNFTEEITCEDDLCWGNTAFALATRLGDSFAKYGWCAHIIGQDGGKVKKLARISHEAMRGIQYKIPTRVVITERRESELAELGFISLVRGETSSEAVFCSANSALRPKSSPGRETKDDENAEVNARIKTQLPYTLIETRLAHKIKVSQRDELGAWLKASTLEKKLREWIDKYKSESDIEKPLLSAKIDVKPNKNDAGRYTVEVEFQPRLKYMGVMCTVKFESIVTDENPAKGR